MFWGAVCRSGQTVSQQLRWRLWATSHISVSTEHKMCCVHLLALPCIYVVIHYHYSITGISNLLFYSSRTKKTSRSRIRNIHMNSCLQVQPHHLLLRHALQTTGNSLQDRQLMAALNELPRLLFHRYFGEADLPNRSNFPCGPSITTCYPWCIYIVCFIV